VANSNCSSPSSATEPYKTPENIRSDLTTHQIKAFREHPWHCSACGHRDKTRPLHRAFRIVRDNPELRRFECARVTYFLGGVLPGVHPANNLINLSTTEPTL
jgi:hypothetical protein